MSTEGSKMDGGQLDDQSSSSILPPWAPLECCHSTEEASLLAGYPAFLWGKSHMCFFKCYRSYGLSRLRTRSWSSSSSPPPNPQKSLPDRVHTCFKELFTGFREIKHFLKKILKCPFKCPFLALCPFQKFGVLSNVLFMSFRFFLQISRLWENQSYGAVAWDHGE